MTTLKVNKPGVAKTPSQEIIDDANRIVHVTDGRGRRLGVRRIGASLRRQIFKALSPESADKRHYLGMVFVVASCCEIDGEEVRLPRTELQFDALIDRLDDDGALAIGTAIQEHFKPQNGAPEEAGE